MDDSDTVRIDYSTGEFGSGDKAGLLQVIRGAEIGLEYDVKPGNNIIGRQKDAQIRIVNKSISRRHAQIICKPEDPPDKRYIIYDLQSTNGTKINNQPVECTAIHDGDRVQFGSVVCKFMEIDSLERSYLKELKKLIEYDKQTELLQLKPFYQKLEPALADAESSGRSLSDMGTPDILGTYGTFSLYTDDPGRYDEKDVTGGKICPVTVHDNTVTAQILGPKNNFKKDEPDIMVDFTVHIDSENSVGKITVQNKEILLNVGEFSEWVQLKFVAIPYIQSVTGVVRFYLKQVRPHFEFYVSPVNIDPTNPALPISTPKGYAAELAEKIEIGRAHV